MDVWAGSYNYIIISAAWPGLMIYWADGHLGHNSSPHARVPGFDIADLNVTTNLYFLSRINIMCPNYFNYFNSL